uniref:PH domain-containing protein n=1 Tax=Acrobeloides nanus TaxID=290746 RepID=A0A914BZP1_9BILA
MFHVHLAPVGLPHSPHPTIHQQTIIENRLHTAISTIVENPFNQTYNGSHPDSRELLNSFDSFFSHGLNKGDRVYWLFVREFIPAHEQRDISLEWNVNSGRALSQAWLKSSLNKNTLQFQVCAFMSCQRAIISSHYHRNACMRNRALLQRVIGYLDSFNDVHFNIESPFVFRTEEIPIALPSQNALQSPRESPSPISLPIARRKRRNINNGFEASTSLMTQTSINDEGDPALIELTRDLPPVNIPNSVHEPYLATTADQDFILNQIVRSHNRISIDSSRQQFTSIPSTTSETAEKSVSDIDEVPDEKINEVIEENILNVDEKFIAESLLRDDGVVSDKSSDSTLDRPGTGTQGDQYSDLPEGYIIDGELPLDAGEIVHLAMEVFQESGERFQKLFMVYSQHNLGTPMLRLFLLTDKRFYLLSDRSKDHGDVVEALVDSNELHEGLSIDGPKYLVHATIPLTEIGHIAVGVDAQVICIHPKKRSRFLLSSENESRILAIETASQLLGRAILQAIRTAFNSMETPLAILTHQTEHAVILQRFVREELNLSHIEIIHHAMIYWHQHSNQYESIATDGLEGYLMYRNAFPKSWLKASEDWQHGYFVLKGNKLYQFSNSSCKFAERSINIRDAVEQIYEVELKKDEQYVFEMTFADDPNVVLQFSCASQDEMKKWMVMITFALSASAAIPTPVACMLTMTDTHLLIAQEGARFYIDGFARALTTLSIQDIANVLVLSTETHYVLILQREKGITDWLFLRTDSELQRLRQTFENKWRLPVEDCNDDEHLGKLPYSRYYKQCIEMPDYWNNVNTYEL